MEEAYNQKGFRHSDEGISNEVRNIDHELEELVKKQSAKIKVIGIGGGGNNSLSRMREIGIKGGELIAMNTDAQDLLYTNADYKILIGRELTKGLGAGSNPRIGEESARESETEIRKKIQNFGMADCVILLTARKLNAKIITGDLHFKGFKEAVMI